MPCSSIASTSGWQLLIGGATNGVYGILLSGAQERVFRSPGSTIIAPERPPFAGPRPYAHERLGRNSDPNTNAWSLHCHLVRCLSRQVCLLPLHRARVGQSSRGGQGSRKR